MTDIVERLRARSASLKLVSLTDPNTSEPQYQAGLNDEAADIIEQLRDLIKKQHDVIVSSSKVIGSLLALEDENDD